MLACGNSAMLCDVSPCEWHPVDPYCIADAWHNATRSDAGGREVEDLGFEACERSKYSGVYV